MLGFQQYVGAATTPENVVLGLADADGGEWRSLTTQDTQIGSSEGRSR